MHDLLAHSPPPPLYSQLFGVLTFDYHLILSKAGSRAPESRLITLLVAHTLAAVEKSQGKNPSPSSSLACPASVTSQVWTLVSQKTGAVDMVTLRSC